MQELVEEIARALADSPDDVSVTEGQPGTLELRVSPNDIGRVIGKQGRTARSIRSVLHAAGEKTGKRYQLEIIE
jgi:predicted RNA-binding protein YlqC (UPF0109 family)